MVKEIQKVKIVEDITIELLKQLEIEAKVTVEEKEDLFNIQLETEQPGILIGYHGETLAAVQLMIGMMAFRKLGEWVRVLVNIGDYRQRRKETLERMALSAAQKVKFSGQAQPLPPMSSFERRIIHLALSNDSELETVSEGEGRERRVVIKRK